MPHGKSGPAPCHTVRQSIDAFPCRSLRRSRRASRQSCATFSVSASGLMVARSSRLGHSGSRLPGHRYESSRHGLAASRPRTPGSGASAVILTANEAFQPLGDTPHCEMQRGGPVSSTPGASSGAARYRGGALHASPSGPATTALQSGQRHASYHPPRSIMSAARDKMLSTPCRARLRAARHYRIAAPGDMPRKTPSAASGRRNGSDGHARQTACPDHLGVSPSRSVDQGCVRMRMGGVRARTSNASTPKRCAAVRSDAGVRRAGTSDAPCGPRTIRRCGGRPFPRRLPVRVERNAPAGSRRLVYYCAPPPVSREIVAST